MAQVLEEAGSGISQEPAASFFKSSMVLPGHKVLIFACAIAGWSSLIASRIFCAVNLGIEPGFESIVYRVRRGEGGIGRTV